MDDLEELIWDVVKDQRLGGCYRVKATGKVNSDDKTYIEVSIGGKLTYAKPCMPFGWFYVPNEKWLKKHKDEVSLWVTFENGNPSHPTWIGVCPLDKKYPDADGYPSVAIFKTEQYSFEFNDEKKFIELKGENFSFKFDTDKEKFTFTHGGGKIILQKNKGIIISAENGKTIHVNNQGKISIGSENASAHPATYADILIEVLKAIMQLQSNLMSAMTTMATTQASASASPPLSPLATGFTTFGTMVASYNSQVNAINQLIPKIKSEIVTID